VGVDQLLKLAPESGVLPASLLEIGGALPRLVNFQGFVEDRPELSFGLVHNVDAFILNMRNPALKRDKEK
jgi:hypothetical protein